MCSWRSLGAGVYEVTTTRREVPGVRVLEELSPEQYERLARWLEHDWPQRRREAGC